MKRIILFVLLVAVGCAKAPIDQAKVNVRQYVKTMLNDPDYYESVSWGSLDSLRQYPPDTSKYQFKQDFKNNRFVYLYSEDGKTWTEPVVTNKLNSMQNVNNIYEIRLKGAPIAG